MYKLDIPVPTEIYGQTVVASTYIVGKPGTSVRSRWFVVTQDDDGLCSLYRVVHHDYTTALRENLSLESALDHLDRVVKMYMPSALV